MSRLNVDVSQGLPLSSPPVSLTYRNRRVRYWTPAKLPRVMLPRWDGGYGAGRAVPNAKLRDREGSNPAVRAGGRRRACALYPDLAVRDPSLDISDRHLCHRLCDHQHHRDGTAAGLHHKDISTEAYYEEPL